MEVSGGTIERTNHDAEPKTSYKSWKKKYRKLRHQFEGVMKRSDELFKQDLVATATIKRITEENNRLLDLLMDLNTNSHIQRQHHQTIGSPSSLTPPRMMSPGTLEEFKTRKFFIDDPDAGDDLVDELAPPSIPEPLVPEPSVPEPSVPEPRAPEPTASAEQPEPMDVDTSATIAPDTSQPTADSPSETNPKYTANGVVHDPSRPLTPPPQPAAKPIPRREIPAPTEPEYIRGSTPPRFRETSPFLNPIEDEELPPGTIIHYHQEDSAFTAPMLPNASPTHSKFPAATNASIPAAAEEEHHWPRNPMSVYCWLRKYQPQVFLQDNEAPGGKERKKKGKRSAAAVEDDDEEHHGHGPSSPAEPKPKRGGTRMSFAGDVSDTKVAAGTKRRRAQKDEGGEDTPEKEGRGGKGKGGSTKPPAAKKPRKSGVKKEED
ncbi:hypothetical protein H072_267 [Dactylellina haptotyla CBS 200.50]|uniref:Uncharacterized protein n=1 Tax=Dactylellina haptotyla (strain CBS 200.50) TaxID=1284197 RepID=S8C2C5_DACHA|nr:hypothetical protein H072_267 [Dactylellina haptotyla CBS 200.50]